jgi:hypothetical protein
METRPPEMIARIVRALVPPASREHVLGDLQERFVSPRRYLVEALQTLPFVVASRVRRTTHPLGLLLAGAFLWFAAFWGNRQESWLAAVIPSLITLTTLALRDAYREAAPPRPREIAFDMALAAAGVLLSQLILSMTIPALLLTRDTLLVGFPLGYVILFFMRLQTPGGLYRSPGFARSISLQDLRTEIDCYEATIRRAIRIEIGACIVVAVCFTGFLWAPAPLIGKIGGGLTSAAALFVWWFLHHHGRVRPIPATLGFAESIAAYRADLQRRLRISESYLWWYVIPLMTGIGLMIIGPQLQRGKSVPSILLSVLILAVVGGILVIVQRGATHKLQQRLEQLDIVGEKPPTTCG